MQEIIAVNPFDCRLWDLHDRQDDLITEESCSTEIDSIKRHGQLVPALGRPLHSDPRHKIELVYGARRLFVARHLNIPLRLVLRAMTDREALIAMDIENRHRKDICAYERGMSYSKWIHSGHFKSQDEIARALRVSASQISRLSSLARLPAIVVQAFPHPSEICEGWGHDLVAALEDPQKRRAIIEKSRAMVQSTPRLHGRDVYRLLLTSTSPGRKIRPKNHDEVVTGRQGHPLFRIQFRNKAIAVLLPLEKMSERSMEQIRIALAAILDAPASPNANDQFADKSPRERALDLQFATEGPRRLHGVKR